MFYGNVTSSEYVVLQFNLSCCSEHLHSNIVTVSYLEWLWLCVNICWLKHPQTCTNLRTDGLTHHVMQPTHRGHILDLVISKRLNISKVLVFDVALCDHYCAFFGSDISVYTNVQTQNVQNSKHLNSKDQTQNAASVKPPVTYSFSLSHPHFPSLGSPSVTLLVISVLKFLMLLVPLIRLK